MAKTHDDIRTTAPEPAELAPKDSVDTLSMPSAKRVDRKRGKRVAIVGGAAGAALVAAGAIFGLAGGDSSDSKANQRPVPTSAEPNTEPSSTVPNTQETTPTTATPEIDRTTGALNLARIIEGEPTMSATRPDKDVIQVPYLRADADPNALAESALAQIAAYITTGDENILNAFTDNDEYKQFFQGVRNNTFDIPNFIKDDNHKDFQLGIYDSFNDPAYWSDTVDENGLRTVSLQGGTVFLQIFYDAHDLGVPGPNSWQSPESRERGSKSSIIDTFSISIGTNAEGQPTVKQMAMQWIDNPAGETERITP